MAQDTKDMVKFQMPDGAEVSNDPRFGLGEALQDQLDSREYGGDAGIPLDEQKAQVSVEKLASIQSGQPGVGENATVDDPVRDAHGPLGSPAQQVQKEDVKEAKEAGATPQETSVDDDDPIDSNERVLEVREERAEKAKKLQEALVQAGEDPGDPDQPYSEWTAKQLKTEVAIRNAQADRAEENQLSLGKKGEVAKALQEDDDRMAAAQQAQGGGSGDPQ